MATIASWQPRPGRNPYDLGSNRASHSGSSAPSTRACSALSAITGIPSGRRRPLRLGTYTRLTARGDHGSAWCCTPPANSGLSWARTHTLAPAPGLLRPRVGHPALVLAQHHHLAVAPGRLAASIDLRHPPHAHQRAAAGPEHQLLQIPDPLQIPCLGRREDPLPPPPHVLLDP